VTGVDATKLTLYALTDTSTKTTFLLPEYFKLQSNDQMAILFHESYWLLHPNATYNQVVNAEMAFEAALTNPNNAARVFNFVQYVGTDGEVFQAELKWDISTNALGTLLKTGAHGYFISIGDLYGVEFFACEQRNGGDVNLLRGFYGAEEATLSPACTPYIRININKLIEQHPQSAILQWYANNLSIFKNSLYLHLYQVQIGGKVVDRWCAGHDGCAQMRSHWSNLTPVEIGQTPFPLQNLANCQIDLSDTQQRIICDSQNQTLIFSIED
jgi:hypothetical protein